MEALNGKRFLFAHDRSGALSPGADAGARLPPGALSRKLKRNAVLGLTVVIPMVLFALDHPNNKTVNPITEATAAASVEGDSVAAEQSALVIKGAKIKGLARIEAAVDSGTGEMRQVYGFGSLSGADPTLRLDFRSHATRAKSAAFSISITESAAKLGAVVRRLGAEQSTATARGALEWADMSLSTSTGPKSCVAFRMAPGGDKRLTGVLCGANGARPDQGALLCVIDRLELTAGARLEGFDALLRGPAGGRANCRPSIG